MTSRRRRNYTVKAVSEVGKFSDTACSVISRLVVEIFYAQKQRNNKVLPFGARGAANYASLCIYFFNYIACVMVYVTIKFGEKRICINFISPETRVSEEHFCRWSTGKMFFRDITRSISVLVNILFPKTTQKSIPSQTGRVQKENLA